MADTDKSSGCFHTYDHGAFGRLEVVSGPAGRRTWPPEVKGRLAAGSYRTELSVSEFARQNGVAPSQLFTWRRLAKAGKLILPAEDGDFFFAPLMVEVEGAAPEATNAGNGDPPAPAAPFIIELEMAGVVLRVPADTPAARIAEIARALA